MMEYVSSDGNCNLKLQILQPDCNWTNHTTNSYNFYTRIFAEQKNLFLQQKQTESHPICFKNVMLWNDNLLIFVGFWK